ncbi:hypothetical protein BDZ94DRAFT_1239795 [Collybia nuda]|uniref:Protein kinase domain-containing protein n=1 Tax=Collybia nuda TaxID=64659 RepID=A0A9P5XY33_9AGAR|nr:hypothetical protein BDZ94DRAFT_1239795 [Collybia nuda]
MPPIVSPIPDRVVAYVGGTNFLLRAYVLWKDGKMIVIQAPPLDLVAERVHEMKERATFTESEYRKLELEYWRGLEIIHTLVDTIDFDRTNWGYLLPRKKTDSGFQITQRKKQFRKITIPLWAPRVDENDIVYTTWWECEHRAGIWNGREVEVFMGWDGDGMQMEDLERSMRGYQYVQGMDLTYEVLGHVMRHDIVIGLMTEPHIGRIMQDRDRALLYDAVSRMERRRIVHMGPTPPNLLIHNGKVRLTNLACVRYFGPEKDEEFKIMAEARHWRTLGDFFSTMDPFPFDIPNYMRNRQPNLHILPEVPSVDRPIRLEIFTQRQARPYLLDMFKLRKEYEKKMERRRDLGLSKRSQIPESLEDELTDFTSEVLEDRPYVVPTARPRSKKRRNEQYNIENSVSRRLLLAHGDS